MNKQHKRNWSQYNQKLVRQASIELYVSAELFNGYTGHRRPGGVVRYSNALIEACLLLREHFSLALRQTQGLMQSLVRQASLHASVPNYTTLCRRAARLEVDLAPKLGKLRSGHIIAVDSTGLRMFAPGSWHRHKHGRKGGNHSWHKLHVAIDTASGEILACDDTPATTNDCEVLPTLTGALPSCDIKAVAADMAYDTIDCRRAIWQMGARQLIPPKAYSVCTTDRVHPLPPDVCQALAERDHAIRYFQHNTINGSDALARKQWKQHVGYHVRSLVETTMSRLKAHIDDTLKARLPHNKHTECRIKCKLLNILNQA